MASCENKYITLLDLSRQAKIITGETACFNGKIELGIPFSGYPTGVDTGSTVSLGVVSSEDAVFSGNSGTTVFDVSNTGSTNYDAIFSGYSATTWSNPLFSGNTSGLTLPITPLSADTQVVGPFWTLTQTGMTGDYVIGTQYTGYSVTYSFFDVSFFGTGFTYSGFTTATQENFSAGTLDYKGPLDYISSVEDATIGGRLTTNKLTVTGGASVSTIGYVLTQTGDTGEAGWVFNSASASTNTFVTGGTLNGTNLDLSYNTGGSVPSIELSGLTFTGNTSGGCITDLYITNLYGCSPITVHDTVVYDGSIIDSATTNSFIFGTNHVLTATSLTHGVTADANSILGGNNNKLTPTQVGLFNTIIGGADNEIGGRSQNQSIISSQNSSITTSFGNTNGGFILGGYNNSMSSIARSGILGGQNNSSSNSNDSGILWGQNNSLVSSPDSIILGGENQSFSFCSDSVIIGGTENSGSSTSNSVIIGGVGNKIDNTFPNNSIIIGMSGKTTTDYVAQNTNTKIYTPSLDVTNEINVRRDVDSNSETPRISIENYNVGNNSRSVLRICVSGNTLPACAYGSIVAFGPDASPTGTFTGAYLPNSLTISSGNNTASERLNINIGSRRGSDAETRFFGGSDDFNNSSLLGTFYTSGLTITDKVNTDTFRIRSTSTPVDTGDASGEVGDVSWDDDYIYIKTSGGWKRTALSTF